MRATQRFALCSIALTLIPGAAGSAQIYTGLDATLASAYVRRGVTRVNHWVSQPEAFLGVSVGAGFLSAGVWADEEWHRAGTRDLSDLGPGHSGVGEVDYWAAYNVRAGAVDASAGYIRYTFRGTGAGAGRTSAANSGEVYGSIRLSSKYLTPKLAVYYDLDRVKGAYVEAGSAISLFGNPLGQPFWVLQVQGLLGYSLGQGVNLSRPSESADFASSGVTHLDLSLSGSVQPIGATTIGMEYHVQFNNDDFTRRINADPAETDVTVKSWAALSVRWVHPW
jgi:hypothetical protein